MFFLFTVCLFMKKSILIIILSFILLCIGTTAWLYALQWHLPLMALFTAPDALPIDALLFQNNTLPRMAMAILAGGLLAVVAVLLQQVMNNPLASDSTLAVSSGAQTTLLLATIFAPSVLVWGAGAVAFVGAVGALLAVLWLSMKRGLVPLVVVLSGLVMSLYLSAFTGALALFYAEEARGLAMWNAGSLVQDSWHDVGVLAMVGVVVGALVALLLKPLNLMALGDEQAQALGIPVLYVRLALLALTAVLVANVVALVGIIGFVGLASSAVVRLGGVRTLGARLMMAFVVGASLLWATDNLLMLINHYYGIDLPAGAVTAFAGAPLLLWLMNQSISPEHSVRSARKQVAMRPLVYLRILPVALLGAILVSLAVGQTEEWGWYVSADSAIWTWRYPRVLASVATGVMSAVAGVLLQRLTQNPMASPELLGIGSGTAVGVLGAILLWNVGLGGWGFWVAGVLGALLTLLLIMFFNHRNGMLPEKILLTGMALSALANASMQAWTATGDFRIIQLQTWLSGSTYAVSPTMSWVLLAVAIVGLCVAFPMQRWLGLLGLNAVVASANGVSVAWARLVLVVLASVLTAVATLTLGPLSFVGLLAPHLALMLGARLPKQQLGYGALLGAMMMVVADWLGRQVMFPYEIPARVVATMLGGTYFLWVMRKM